LQDYSVLLFQVQAQNQIRFVLGGGEGLRMNRDGPLPLFEASVGPVLAHRDERRSDGQLSLSAHCGHEAIFDARRSVANDSSRTSRR
jgi:hypothetical protein